MNEPRPVLPQGQHGSSSNVGARPVHPQGHVSPRPAGAPLRSPIAPPPAQRLPGQPAHVAAIGPGLRASPPPLPAARGAGAVPLDGEEELIDLEDEDAAPATPAPVAAEPPPPAVGHMAPPSKIRLTGGGDKHSYTRFKRPTHVTGTGASRLRTFHGRLSDEGLAFMDDKINEWLDTHPDVEVKHVTTLIGTMEGKHGEQAMFVTIWY